MSKSTTFTDAVNSDPKAIEDGASMGGKLLIPALDKAVHMQTSAIAGYVAWLKKKNPDHTPVQIQKLMDAHLKRIAAGSGASVGLAAAFPGIGFMTGALAVGAESLVFLDAVAFYTMASAHLRGVDISHPERRRALILVVLLGAQGTALVDAAVGDISKTRKTPAASISRFSISGLADVNSRLLRMAIKRLGKRFRGVWLGKILPLGVGAVIGTLANRKLAAKAIGNAQTSLGPVPANWS
ncbi:hypothetical protein CFAEC_05425 [Corynebacterium faecale]|uniref:hypothetical protein n=1 Tax=Corynebacterium faecale TaxID=1758466 RepID=UPI0025B4DDCA|nr:hypothetical protein [Corynebacterium faecale]WJY91923.1 hypothetical protein CFAEC_05425 [Corynebacterium faecale]